MADRPGLHMPPTLPSDIRDVVLAHKHDTILFVVALGDLCRPWAQRSVDAIPPPRRSGEERYGRDVRLVDPEGVRETQRQRSWALAVLLCGGDPAPLVHWANQLPARDLGRIRFFLCADQTVPAAWPDNHAEYVDLASPRRLTHHLLSLLIEQVYRDFAPQKPPGVLGDLGSQK
jgi:hypothetical protein